MKITIVTTMRNEGRHLLEWIAYHQAIGVSDFLVYTNDCEDGTDALLELLPSVTHIPLQAGEKPPQWRALRDAWDHPLVQNADWIACIDCDEFININNDLGGIPNLIKHANADAIVLPWRLFGSSGQVEFDAGSTLQTYTNSAPHDMLYPAIGSYFKTLFRRAGPFRQLGVHRPKQKNVDRHPVPVWADAAGEKMTGQLPLNDGQIMNWGQNVNAGLVQLNHYSVRSVSDYMIKRSRGLPNHQSKSIDLTYWVERNFNSINDRSIQTKNDAVEEELNNFRKIEGVIDVEDAAKNWAKQKLKSLLNHPEELGLFGRLILAGSSTPPEKEQALELIRAYQVAHG